MPFHPKPLSAVANVRSLSGRPPGFPGTKTPLQQPACSGEVHADVPGDTYVPAVDAAQWREIGRDDFQAEGPNPYDYSFVVYERV